LFLLFASFGETLTFTTLAAIAIFASEKKWNFHV
jgi:hypothetical protein